jgi:hypothetical protein
MAGFFDPTDPTMGGLMGASSNPVGMGGMMGMLANPQTAGMLGMSQGLLNASGPSRIPVTMGQAMGAGLGGMQQDVGNAYQLQRQMMMMQAMNNALGGGQQPGGQQAPAPQVAPAPAVAGGANSGPMSGLMAGMGSMAPTPQSAASSAQGAYPAAPSASANDPVIPGTGMTASQMMQKGQAWNLISPGSGTPYIEAAFKYNPAIAASMPTDITKMGVQGGMTAQQIQAANLAGLNKANAPVSLRSPIYWDPTTGTAQAVPASVLQAGYGAQYGAQEGAKAANQNEQVWDPTANNGQGGMVFQTRAQINAAATGAPTSEANASVPAGIRNNNFGNIKGANGQFATYDTPQAGVNAADQLLSTYGSRYGINTLAGIANRWSPKGEGNNDPAAKAATMAAASGVGVNDPINLADPATRSRILPALFDTETPGWRTAIGGGQPAPQRAGPTAAQPPMGAQTAANASQGAPSEQMKTAYGSLSTADANYQQSREALNEMLNLAGNKGVAGGALGLLPESVATRISPDAATYQKAHATYVALQGKALGSGGTDASRATLDEAVPTYDKPQPAMVTGLTNQLNNLDQSHLKTQFLTPIYQQGNEKAFTQQSAAFDQNIKPTMMPILQLQGDAQRAAVQSAIKANPALRPNFEWAFNNGLLK